MSRDDVGQLTFLAPRPPLRLKYFCPRAKGGFIPVVLAYSPLISVRLNVSLYRIPLWSLPRKRGIALAGTISRDKSRVDIRGEIRNS